LVVFVVIKTYNIHIIITKTHSEKKNEKERKSIRSDRQTRSGVNKEEEKKSNEWNGIVVVEIVTLII
jgi:hypothetical protein